MARGRSAAQPQWVAPPTEQLVVIERQMRGMIGEADELKTRPFDDDSWGSWQANLGDLVDRAFGRSSAQATSYHWAGGIVADGPGRGGFYQQSDYERARVQWRNNKIDAYAAAANGAVKAIALELERRGAVAPPAPSLPARSFAKVADVALRGIAERDYDELRKVAPSTVLAATVLAGGVIEAVLNDALRQRGYAAAKVDAMRLFELIDEAVTAGILTARAKAAAHHARDARNLVHPAVELKDGRLTKGDAEIVLALMSKVLEELL